MAVSNTGHNELEKLRAQNARLRAENGRLEKMINGQKHTNHTNRNSSHLFRRIGVGALIVISVALLTAGNLLFWFGNTIVKPDRFADATAPIIKDTKVQQTMALYTTNNIFKSIDVQKITEEALPPKADFLAPQLATQLKSVTEKTLQKTLAKPTFQEKWNTVLANQHERIVNFAAKHNGDGNISLNDVYNQLSASLQNTKLSFLSNKKLPDKVGTVTVVSAPWLPAFHNLVTNIDTWRLITVTTFILCVALAAWLSSNRRKTLYIISVLSSIFMLISLVALRVTREAIAQKADPQYAEGVRSALQIFFHPLLLQTATILFAFVLVAIVAWISSESRSAASLRNQVGLLFSGKLHTRLFGEDTNRYTGWVSHNKHLLEWGVVSVIALTMLLVRLTLKSLIIYAFLMIILILTIEVIGGNSENKVNKRKRFIG
jgi:hypothetical protein